jgi:glycosyltransferase involved in cell wall biosynthesis
MRIAYFIGTFPTLSETFVAREVLNLQRLGYEIELFAVSRSAPEVLAKYSPAVQALAAKTHYIDIPQIVLSIPHSLTHRHRTAIQLNRQLQAVATLKSNPLARLVRAYTLAVQVRKMEITHIHAHWPYASLLAALVHHITGIPYSISVHAHEVAHENGHFPLLFRTLNFALFCNRAAMEYLLKQLPETCRRRSYLVYHGVDTAEFVFSPLPTPYQPLRLLSVGRLTKTKGFDRLLEACAEAVKAGIEVELTILGNGTLYDELKQQAQRLGLGSRLRMPGWIPHAEVCDYLTEAHLFVLLAQTDYSDGLPNVVLEAMACGRPVILSPLPAAAEVVTSGQEGFVLSAADDIQGLIHILYLLANNPDEIARMGLAARTRVVTYHNASVEIQRLAALFENYPVSELS